MSVASIPPIGAGSDKWVEISSTTASGSTVTFSSISGYRKLAILVAGVTTNFAGTFNIRLNGDTASNYWSYKQISNGSSTYYATMSQATGIQPASTTTNTTGVSAFITIDNTDSSTIKNISGWVGPDVSATYMNLLTGSVYKGSATISSVSIVSSQTFNGGTITLYGVVA